MIRRPPRSTLFPTRRSSDLYIELVERAPDVLGWLYDRLDTPWEKERRRLAWYKLNTRPFVRMRSEEHTSELQSLAYLVCRLLLEKKKKKNDSVLYDAYNERA